MRPSADTGGWSFAHFVEGKRVTDPAMIQAALIATPKTKIATLSSPVTGPEAKRVGDVAWGACLVPSRSLQSRP
jgi:hypothetical protein